MRAGPLLRERSLAAAPRSIEHDDRGAQRFDDAGEPFPEILVPEEVCVLESLVGTDVESRATIRQEHSPGRGQRRRHPGRPHVEAGRAGPEPHARAVERCRPSGSHGSRLRAASPESGAAGERLGGGRAVRAVRALAAETSPRPPAAVGPQRGGGWRPAIWCRTCCITPSPGSPGSSRSTSAPCAPISGAPWRTASRTSCAGPSSVWTSPASPLGRTPCGPSRTRRHSISDACGRSCRGVTGTA